MNCPYGIHLALLETITLCADAERQARGQTDVESTHFITFLINTLHYKLQPKGRIFKASIKLNETL